MARLLLIATFVTVVVVFLGLADFVVFETLAANFDITGLTATATGLILGLLSAGFILATVVGMRYYNKFTKIYYCLSAVWMGFFAYFFLAAVAYSFIALFTIRFRNILGDFLFGLAFVTGLYGLRHAKKIKIKEIKISLPNLPESWSRKKIAWLSDLHLGQLLGRSFAEGITAKVKSLKPDIIFIGGDLFDGTTAPDLDRLIDPFKNLTAPLGVYFITGNHEEFGDDSKFLAAAKGAGLKTLIDEKTDIAGLQIIGIDYHRNRKKDEFRKNLSGLSIDPKRPAILLKHEPKDLDVAQAAGISLQISGHTHKAQIWPFNYISRLVYGGFDYGLKNFKGMPVYVSSGAGTWGPPMRVGSDSEIIVFILR